MEFVYIITGPHIKKNYYKIGLHTVKTGNTEQAKQKLIARYRTALLEPDVIRFYRCFDAKRHEREIHHILRKYRVKRVGTGRDSEWFKISRKKVLNVVDAHFGMATYNCCLC